MHKSIKCRKRKDNSQSHILLECAEDYVQKIFTFQIDLYGYGSRNKFTTSNTCDLRAIRL